METLETIHIDREDRRKEKASLGPKNWTLPGLKLQGIPWIRIHPDHRGTIHTRFLSQTNIGVPKKEANMCFQDVI